MSESQGESNTSIVAIVAIFVIVVVVGLVGWRSGMFGGHHESGPEINVTIPAPTK